MLEWLAPPISIEISADAVVRSAVRPSSLRRLALSPQRQRIGIAADRRGALGQGGAPEQPWLKAMLQALGTVLDAVSPAPKNRSVQVFIADELARLWLTSPPSNAAEPGDCVAAATLRFESLFGLAAEVWQISADWDAGRPFLCAALPRALVDALSAAFVARGITVLGIAPHWVGTWNKLRGALNAGDWVADVAENTVTVVRAGGRGWRSGLQPDVVRVLPLPVAQTSQNVAEPPSAKSFLQRENTVWLAQNLAREAMRLDLPAPQRVLLCGQSLPVAAINSVNDAVASPRAGPAMRFERISGGAAAPDGAIR
jgi:hypothetical protein